MGTTPGRAFLDRRISFIEAGDFDGMVDDGYNENAELVSFDAVVKGKDALKKHFGMHLSALGSVKLKSVDNFVETDDAVFVQVTVSTGKYGDVTSYEAFSMRDGKADQHFTVVRM